MTKAQKRRIRSRKRVALFVILAVGGILITLAVFIIDWAAPAKMVSHAMRSIESTARPVHASAPSSFNLSGILDGVYAYGQKFVGLITSVLSMFLLVKELKKDKE